LRIRITNALGAEVMNDERSVNAGAAYRHAVDVASLPIGVYMVEVQDGTSRSVRKIVKN
jgi:hypothetical protein